MSDTLHMLFPSVLTPLYAEGILFLGDMCLKVSDNLPIIELVRSRDRMNSAKAHALNESFQIFAELIED